MNSLARGDQEHSRMSATGIAPRKERPGFPLKIGRRLRSLRACVAVLAVLAFGQGPASAANLVDFTFGTGVGTNAAQSVAEHLHVTAAVGRDRFGNPAPYYFSDLLGGNMGLVMNKSGGGYLVNFTLTADPGYTFQVTDALFDFGAAGTAGAYYHVGAWANDALSPPEESMWFGVSGGDLSFHAAPGGSFWQTSTWNSFSSRTDLYSLMVQVYVGGNTSNYISVFDRMRLDGNVLAVPEPSVYLMLLAGLGLLGFAARRRV